MTKMLLNLKQAQNTWLRPTPRTGGEGSTQTTPENVRFDQFSIYIAEKYKDSYDGVRGLLGLGGIVFTTCKIITCGRNANNPNGAKSAASVVNYLTFTMTEYLVIHLAIG